jgi:hypothetical protein
MGPTEMAGAGINPVKANNPIIKNHLPFNLITVPPLVDKNSVDKTD